MQPLDAIEARVLGVLIEKAQTTPGQYPLTLNGLTLGCNQKNNRDPVMEITEDRALDAIDGLRAKGYLREAMLSGSRVTKYRHIAREALDVPTSALVLLAELLLRGPQPVGELRGHALRMLVGPGADADLASIELAERLLESLMNRAEPLVVRLPNRPGERAPRFAQLLAPSAHPEPAPHVSSGGAPAASGSRHGAPDLSARLEALESEVAALRREVADLRAQLGGQPVRHALIPSLVALLAFLTGCGRSADDAPAPITVFAAASTAGPLDEAARAFERATGARVQISYGASLTLARQIAAGARADLAIFADQRSMDELASAAPSGIDASTRAVLLTNTLVLVAPVSSTLSVDLSAGAAAPDPPIGRLAIGDPAVVPAGRYAQQALERLGWWTPLQEALLPAPDVRAALRLVELGEADAGIVYATDARASTRVRVVAPFPAALHDPIAYPVALCKEHAPRAAEFLGFLRTDAGRAPFARAGFSFPTDR